MKIRSLFSSKVFRLIVVVIFMFPLLANSEGKPNLVGPTRIYVDTDATGSDNGTDWTNAYVHLQDALDVTNTNGSTDYEIWVAEGVYYPDEENIGTDHTDNDQTESFTISYNNVKLYGGFAGTESSLDQQDWLSHPTVLSGDIDKNDTNVDGNFIAEDWNDISGNNAYHVLFLNGTLYEDITLYTVIDGFWITGGDSDPTNNYGGGLFCVSNSSTAQCDPSLRNLTFQGNTAEIGGGIMLYADFGGISSPEMTNLSFIGNWSAGDGGGIASWAANSASGESSPVLVNVKFHNNYAGDDGGGMSIFANQATSSPTLTNVEFWNNEAAGDGGGLSALVGNTGTVSPVLTNTSFSGNQAFRGGGLVTFKTFDATFGMQLVNSIIWGNTATDARPDVYNYGTSPIVSYSDIQGSGGSSSWDSTFGTDNGGNLDLNPQFVNATLGDLTLQAISPMIDAGNKSLLPIDVTDLDKDFNFSETLPDDLLLNHRVEFTEVDMGAFEYSPAYDNVGFYVPDQLKWYLKNNQTNGWTDFVAFKFGGPSGSLAVSGDWDNDGVDSVGFYVPSQGKWYLKNNQINGWNGFVAFNFGGPSGSIPVAGDWDNDGVDTVGFYVPSQGKWYLKNNQINGWNDYLAFNFAGPSGSQPVAGDWDNDGVDTIGFYVPSQGKWYLKNNQINGWNDFVAVNFAGASGSLAVAGDWDGDGVDTIGFYVPSQGKWYLKNNQINGWNDYVAFKFGGPSGSQPVAGDWQ